MGQVIHYLSQLHVKNADALLAQGTALLQLCQTKYVSLLCVLNAGHEDSDAGLREEAWRNSRLYARVLSA